MKERNNRMSNGNSQHEWIERWHGSEPQRGWSIVQGREAVAYLGGDESMSEAVSAIVAAHNAALAASASAEPVASAEESFNAYADKFNHESNEWLDMDVQTFYIEGFKAGNAAPRPIEAPDSQDDDEQREAEYFKRWENEAPAQAVALSAEQERWLHVDEVKQLCRDFSSRTGSVYIKDMESALDGLAALSAPASMSAENRPAQVTFDAWWEMGGTNTNSPYYAARSGWDAALSLAAKPAVDAQSEIDRLMGLLAECRDAFPVPGLGSALEGQWAGAMGDPAEVPAYVRAALSAIAANGAGQKPVAWLHTMHMEGGQLQQRLSFSNENPFGTPGLDYSEEYEVISEPLVHAAPADNESAKDAERIAFYEAHQCYSDRWEDGTTYTVWLNDEGWREGFSGSSFREAIDAAIAASAGKVTR